MARLVRCAAVAAAFVPALLPAPASAALACTTHDVGTGRVSGVVQPAGTPDTDWVLTSTPLLGAPSPAVVADPFPIWGGLPGAAWVSVPGGSQAGTLAPVGALWPNGTYVYETRFVVPPLASGSLNLAFLVDNDVQFTLNGVAIGGYVPPAPGDGSSYTTPRGVSSGVFTGVNVLQARVTNHWGPTGLVVSGGVTICV